MSKVVLMQGLIASGKSTRAKELTQEIGNVVRLNRDLLRTMLHFDKWTGINEQKTIEAQILLARKFLADNTSVIIDDTNLSLRTVERWKTIAKETGSKFEIVKMDTSLEECLKRDQHREKRVGHDVIMKMAMQFGMYKPASGYIICDLDGTICDLTKRLHYVKGEGKKDWKKFFEELSHDDPRVDVVIKVNYLIGKNLYDLVFVSGRPEEYRHLTEEWFMRNLPGLWKIRTALIMRSSGDKRDDDVVKKDILEKYFLDKSLVKVVLDDRPRIIRMWKDNLPDAEICDVGDGIEF